MPQSRIFKNAVKKFGSGRYLNAGICPAQSYMFDHVLPKTWGVFRLDTTVARVFMETLESLRKKYDQASEQKRHEYLDVMDKYLAPPYPVTWLEMPNVPGDDNN